MSSTTSKFLMIADGGAEVMFAPAILGFKLLKGILGPKKPTQAANVAYLRQHTEQTVTQECEASLDQTLNLDHVTIQGLHCDGENVAIGDNIAWGKTSCASSAATSALAKAVAMQDASARKGFLAGSAQADNTVDVQQSIAQNIAQRCGASNSQLVNASNFTITDVTGSDCSVLTNAMSTRFACTMQASESASESATADQKARAVSSGATGFLLALALAMIVACVAASCLFGLGFTFLNKVFSSATNKALAHEVRELEALHRVQQNALGLAARDAARGQAGHG